MYAQNRKIGNPKYFKSVREQYNQVFENNTTKCSETIQPSVREQYNQVFGNNITKCSGKIQPSVLEQYNQVFGNNKTKGPKQNSLTSVKP
jgi:hypothetical protein